VNGSVEQPIATETAPLGELLARMCYRFELAALGVWFVARWLVYGANVPLPVELPFIDAITLVIATLATLFGLSRWWPSQNVIAVTFLTFAFSAALEHVISISASAPFPESAGKTLVGIPLSIPLLWLVVMLNARGVARLILWPHREKGSYGLWLIFFTALMTALLLLAQESISHRFYSWEPLLVLFGVRFLGAVFLLAIVAPFFIPKTAIVPTPACGPVAIWSVINLYVVIAAGIYHYWETAGILIVMNGVLTTLSLRARKKRKPKAPTQTI
jgi:hypothetical protein